MPEAEQTETTTDPGLARQRLRLWLQMLKAVRFVEADLRDRLRQQHDMTLPRFDVLAALMAAPDGLRMTELSQQLMVSNGNVTGIVDRLVADGLAQRETIETDRRAYRIRISAQGDRLMRQITAEHLGWIDELFEQVTEADAARGISIMLDIRHKTPR
ncbi:MarR family transcriptional regulator [Paracoccus caeni]|uniref:MarR family transcriptional regulator n=1 Tax=Paracoccus caeni TaxID=657651 RepID=A0A934VZA4_9RHOB|nr:MarR family transcriptional regulator [Paracoccus caeni]MBK4215088.1 MarR family transcriptional regulator [Paracoccus caeni]